MPFIEWIQPNYTYAIQTTPSDTYYQSHQWALDKINTTPLWPYLSSQCNTIAAIIDTGIDIDHEFNQKHLTNTNEIPNNQIDDDNNGYIMILTAGIPITIMQILMMTMGMEPCCWHPRRTIG